MLSKELKEKLINGTFQERKENSDNEMIRALDLGGYVDYNGKEIFLTNDQVREIEKKTGKKFVAGELC
ncbi:MAG: hypothetical protein ACK5HR_01390 [Mycoplasmatales bacterium]